MLAGVEVARREWGQGRRRRGAAEGRDLFRNCGAAFVRDGQCHRVCDPVPELRIQFRNRGFETIPQDLSKPVTAFVARLGFRRDLHMSAEPAEPPGGSLWLL